MDANEPSYNNLKLRLSRNSADYLDMKIIQKKLH